MKKIKLYGDFQIALVSIVQTWSIPFVLVQPSITNYQRLGGLNNRNFLLNSSRGWEVQDEGASRSGVSSHGEEW